MMRPISLRIRPLRPAGPSSAGLLVPPSASPFGSRLLGSADQTERELRVRVQLLLTVALVTTHVVGAVIVVVLSTFVIPRPAANQATVLSLAIAIPAYVVVAILAGTVLGTLRTLRALSWLRSDVQPTDAERQVTLRVPLRLTELQAGLWAGATVLFSLLALLLQPDRLLSTGLSLTIAGAVVCATAYLLAEFVLRPVAARALAGDHSRQPRTMGVASRMLVFWTVGSGVPTAGLVVVALLALTGDDFSTTRVAVIILVLAGVVLVFGLAITVLNARAVVAPIRSVRDALAAVEAGDLDQQVPVYDGTELGLLQDGFNQMVSGLREREHLRDLFGRHVGQEVARAAAAAEFELGGETRVATVLFLDLVGSTSYAAQRAPAEVVDMLNRFFTVVVDEVDRHGGFVNKFMGDAALAVFGAPVAQPDHAGRGLVAARAIASRLGREVPEIEAGIGVVTGEVVAGNVGARSRFEYTVIGDAVNAAARLTELAKQVDGRILSSWPTVQAAGPEGTHWVRHGCETLRGRHEPTELAVPAD